MKEREPIEVRYSKLRLAQDLNKSTLDMAGLQIAMRSDSGVFVRPTHADVVAHLNSLAEREEIDHYVLDGEHGRVFLFDPETVLSNLKCFEVEAIRRIDTLPVFIYNEPVGKDDDVPIEISGIKDLFRLPTQAFQSGPCVYFLCHEGRVVYVGQAMNVSVRVADHMNDKLFDQVCYIRVPVNKLLTVEAALIAHLKPVYNKTALNTNSAKEVLALSILQP